MQFNQATTEQLFTIAYYEPVSLAERYKAMQELNKRRKRVYGVEQERIVRKRA